jgi:multidrug efflux pump subunit AcrB
MASSAAPVQLVFYGPDLDRLAAIGEQARKLAEGIPGFSQVATSWDLTLPQLHVGVDRARAQELGRAAADVADQAYYALKGGLTTEFYRLDNRRQLTMLVRPLGDQRRDALDADQVKILMTSLVSTVVLIPAAFFPRTGTDAYVPLATVTIGGMVVGVGLALYVVPVVHTYTDDLARAVGALVRRRWRRRGETPA